MGPAHIVQLYAICQ